MSLLTVVQKFCRRQNLPVPTTVVGSSDPQITQIMGLLEEEGDDLASRHPWQGITFEAALTTTATENQGAMTAIASNGFKYVKNETLWDRSTRLVIAGPLDAKDWQKMKALFATGPRYRYRIRGDHLLVNPVPPAGESWYFEYGSENWILAVDGTTYKSAFTLDTDTFILPEKLFTAGLRWRWLREKGMDYAELFRTYETQVQDAMGRDGSKPRLAMDDQPNAGPVPGIFVSPGSWI